MPDRIDREAALAAITEIESMNPEDRWTHALAAFSADDLEIIRHFLNGLEPVESVPQVFPCARTQHHVWSIAVFNGERVSRIKTVKALRDSLPVRLHLGMLVEIVESVIPPACFE